MAKIYGLQGVLSGKLGNSVMAVRNGVQLVRQYQPIVANPSTPAQIENRAKLKLMSQLSAVFAPVIPLRRIGAVSSRNRFVSLNFIASAFADDAATIDMSAIKLTNSVVAIPNISATRVEGGIQVGLTNGVTDIDRVVYIEVRREGTELRLVGSVVQDDPGDNLEFFATLPASSVETFVYAYGVRLNSDAARVAFGNLTLPTATQVATLLVSSSLLESDVTLTETRYVSLAAAQ